MEKRTNITHPLCSQSLDTIMNCFAAPNFSFAMNLKFDKVIFQRSFGEYLGLPYHSVHYDEFLKLFLTEEYSKLTRIHRLLCQFYKLHHQNCASIRFTLAHGLKRNNGNPIKVLREVYFLQLEDHTNEVIVWNNCIEITNLPLALDFQFDIALPPKLENRKRMFMQLFDSVSLDQESLFTTRQLEVLRVWKEMDNIDAAAHSLGISKRTLETHLRNMRKKIGVRRTVDVVMYARERGWV